MKLNIYFLIGAGMFEIAFNTRYVNNILLEIVEFTKVNRFLKIYASILVTNFS